MKHLILILAVFISITFSGCRQQEKADEPVSHETDKITSVFYDGLNLRTEPEFLEQQRAQEAAARTPDKNLISGHLARDGLYFVPPPGIYHIMDAPAMIRRNPGLNSEIIGQLALHEKIEITGPAEYIQEINNIWAGWFPVMHRGAVGYIWGGHVAVEALVMDVDGNGITDYFYFRYRDIQQYYGLIDVWEDIVIYINNRRIPTRDMSPRYVGGCSFHYNGVNVIISLTEGFGTVISYEVNINKYGRVEFIRDQSLDRQNEFLSRGHGFELPWRENPRDLMERLNLITSHEEIIDPVFNTMRITLKFEDRIITLLAAEANNYLGRENYVLESIESTSNGEYLFGIKHGTHRNELIRIFGERASLGNSISFQLWCRYERKAVEITLENNKVKSILWTFGIK
ncbi:MAG: SH3 domain-containing protein [Spirochaetes bacterium]|nr:SH3 domain-containing protein [Spirochaetota bacterium]